MSTTLLSVLILNSLFFFIYGFQALKSELMIKEFKRFGMTDSQRKLIGILQILGSSGLITGLALPVIGIFASAGLTIMMLIAFFVRIKIKDSFSQSVPSFVFFLINGWLTYSLSLQFF